MQNPAAIAGLPAGQATPGTPPRRVSDVGACFQLALLAAAQNNDQEAGDYLRQIIPAMKAMVGSRETDAGSGPNP